MPTMPSMLFTRPGVAAALTAATVAAAGVTSTAGATVPAAESHVATGAPAGNVAPASSESTVPGSGDTDGDGLSDNADPDADGDGVNNLDEIAAGTDPLRRITDPALGPDGERDSDGDGISNRDESYVPTRGPGPGGVFVDINRDGLGDVAATDRNGNGYADIMENQARDIAVHYRPLRRTTDSIWSTTPWFSSRTRPALDPNTVPEKAQFRAIGDPAPTDEPLTIVVNPNTGLITVTAAQPLDHPVSTSITLQVTFSDGTQATHPVPIVVAPADARTAQPLYSPSRQLAPDVFVVSPPVFDNPLTDTTETTAAPAGTSFHAASGTTYPDGVNVTIDPDTGAITARTTDGQAPRAPITVPIIVTYPDGSTSSADVQVYVTGGRDLTDDFDGDGIINELDPDVDGDGVNNDDELATLADTTHPGGHLDPWNQDSDGDGISDGQEDFDGDGKLNDAESKVPEGPYGTTASQPATDNMAHPGITDEKPSPDGVSDVIESAAKVGRYPGDGDLDGDGIIDRNDPDIDGDGISNTDEMVASGIAPNAKGEILKLLDHSSHMIALDPWRADTNGNGIVDGDENTDGDTAKNSSESAVPRRRDSGAPGGWKDTPVDDVDGDGVGDTPVTDHNDNGIPDLADGMYSARSDGTVDLDNDGIPDADDPDVDGDGITNDDELATQTDSDPTNDLDPRNRDTDGNGIFDGAEDSDGDGVTNAAESHVPGRRPDGSYPPIADANNDGFGDTGITDNNHNGIPDLTDAAYAPGETHSLFDEDTSTGSSIDDTTTWAIVSTIIAIAGLLGTITAPAWAHLIPVQPPRPL